MVYHISIVLSGKARPSQLTVLKVSQLSVKKIGPRMGPCLLLVEPYWSAERINFTLNFTRKTVRSIIQTSIEINTGSFSYENVLIVRGKKHARGR